MNTQDTRARARVKIDAPSASIDVPISRNAPVDGSAIFIPDETHERRVQAVIDTERVKREARRRLDAEERGLLVPPPIETLHDRLARPRLAAKFRIHDMQPQASRVIFAAPFKAGKTTVVGNLVRSLADGEAFLGRFPVVPVDGTIALLDFEMSGAQLDGWLRAQQIRHDERVLVMPMRGRATAFNILDAEVRTEWAARFRERQVDYLVIDCLRPILDALGLDEHHDPGRFLVALDALLCEAGISECLVVHHMGHLSERARGDSRLRDWPDVEWRLLRQTDDPTSPRYITAYGRDVNVPESQLLYDSATRALTIANGSRRDATTRGALDAILAVLKAATEPLSGRAIKKSLAESDHRRDAIDSALRHGARMGALTVEDGPRNSKLYSLPGIVPVSASILPVSENGEQECPTPVREGTLAHSLAGDEYAPGQSDTPLSKPALKARSRREPKEPIS